MVQKAITELQLKAALEPITREVNDMRHDLAEMKKVVTGNGAGIGLDEQVRSIERDVKKHDELLKQLPLISSNLARVSERLENQNRIAFAILTTVGGYIAVEVVKFILSKL
ncbi:MAG: hypothetical protein ACOY4M_08415 [Pseudomonadota bacterium]